MPAEAAARREGWWIETVHMMRKQWAKYDRNRQLSLADQFERPAS